LVPLWLIALQGAAQQNLVYNGDFEEYDSCPVGFSDPSQNLKEITKCLGWSAPTYGTSDYFNVCASGSNVGVPINTQGEQVPYSGNGYVGCYFTNYTGGAGNGYNGIMWWEYVQGKLVSPLEKGKIYKLSMEVSLAEISDLMISEIGVLFSEVPVSTMNTASLNDNPQCVFYDPEYFKDTLNWMHVESYFIANGNEQFVTIGNFRNNTGTDTLRRYDLGPVALNPFFTYFYVDHVVLTAESIDVPNIFTPNKDGINDTWSLPFSDALDSKKVSILNRWGNVICEGDLKNFAWDGRTQNGDECIDGIYFYRISNTNVSGFIQLVH
jgi:gliding motility-associated-like protein